MATASSYRCMCISQWSILIAMLLVASIASAVVLGVGFILKQQSPQHCKPEASGMATNNTNRMQRGQLDLGDRNNFDMNVDIDSDYINGLHVKPDNEAELEVRLRGYLDGLGLNRSEISPREPRPIPFEEASLTTVDLMTNDAASNFAQFFEENHGDLTFQR